MTSRKSIDILHLSDIQFGKNHRFGVDVKTEDGKIETLLSRLLDDLEEMKKGYRLNPELIVITGDLAEWGMKKEYDDLEIFLKAVLEYTKLEKSHVVLVPGNHDVNRDKCSGYFSDCKGDGEEPVFPYWKKWELYKKFFDRFYSVHPDISFAEEKPWTFFSLEDLKIVVAGLNSTMKESHRDEDHYGWCGEAQYRWFADKLKDFKEQGWFRIGAIHHNIRRGATKDDVNLHDEVDLKKYLENELNLILHGHVHDAGMDWLHPGCPVLAAGSSGLIAKERPEDVPNQYQIIRIEKDKISRWCRAYSIKQKKWIGDNVPVKGGNKWFEGRGVTFENVSATFSTDEEKKETDNEKKKKVSPGKVTPDVDLKEEIKHYRQKIESLHKDLPVAGFATQIKVPVNIEDIHIALHAILDLTGLNEVCFDDSGHAKQCLDSRGMGLEISLFDGFGQAAKRGFKGIVILGDPGSGKTTHLKRVLLWCLKNSPDSLGLPKEMLPVFLPLREIDDTNQGLDRFIEQQLTSPHLKTSEGFGKRLLERGNLLFLLDGLDEVSDLERREEVAKWIGKAMQVYSNCVFVVTCRFAGYSPTVKLKANFLEMHIRPFTEEQAEAFIHNWYRIVEKGLATDTELAESQAREKASNLIEDIKKPDFRSSRLLEMTRNPLLLTNICLVHRFRGSLPDKRSRLYKDCIEVLLESWRKAKGLSVEFSAENASRALQPAAFWLHDNELKRAKAEDLSPHIEPVLKAIEWKKGDAKDFLKTIRDESGLLTGWDQSHYGFMHLGFQEYLAAREIRSRAFKDSSILKELAGHFGQSWWNEVILLMLALEDPSLFEPFLQEVVTLPAFVNSKDLVELCLNDAAEKSVAPFIELVKKSDKGNKDLWERQFYALQIAQRLDKDAVDRISPILKEHPSLEIQKWVGEKSKEKTQQTIRPTPSGYELVRIPGGSFMMGSPETEAGRFESEGPLHEVTVPDFYMGRYPVTNQEYAVFLKENPKIKEPEYWGKREFNQPKQPVVGVSWDDTQKYAKWAGLRLPTEAEWEYACRAGTKTRYYTGDSEKDLDRAGWYWENAEKQTHPVGEKEPNAFGLYDMHGNVLEWIEDDWHSDYNNAPNDGSAWIDKKRGSNRVLRGGSWINVAHRCRSADRNPYSPDSRYDNIGFRLSRFVALDP